MPDLLVTEADGVATLTMNRPDSLNALGGNMLTEMLEALTRIAGDMAVGCVVLTGAGRGFSAGGDMKARATGEQADPRRHAGAGADALRSAWRRPASCTRCRSRPSPW